MSLWKFKRTSLKDKIEKDNLETIVKLKAKKGNLEAKLLEKLKIKKAELEKELKAKKALKVGGTKSKRDKK